MTDHLPGPSLAIATASRGWLMLTGSLGVCGFGNTHAEACAAFDRAWRGEAPHV